MSALGVIRTEYARCHFHSRLVVNCHDLQGIVGSFRQPIEAMEKTKMRFTLLIFIVLLSGGHRLAAQENVEARGITSVIKLEEVIFGHLVELNGKFKLRATEVTFAPEAYLGVHHHAGPGIRYVLSGEVTFTEGGQGRSIRLGIIFLKRETSHIPLRIRRTCRFAYCSWKSFRKTGQVRRLLHLSHNERACRA
jgi:quercetin dioxygenase-like cupin family protein